MNLRSRVTFDPHWCDGPPNGAFAFLAWFQRQIDGIPLESQGGARIEIDAEIHGREGNDEVRMTNGE